MGGPFAFGQPSRVAEKWIKLDLFRGSKSRNKVSVGEPAEGSLTLMVAGQEQICFCPSAVVHTQTNQHGPGHAGLGGLFGECAHPISPCFCLVSEGSGPANSFHRPTSPLSSAMVSPPPPLFWGGGEGGFFGSERGPLSWGPPRYHFFFFPKTTKTKPEKNNQHSTCWVAPGFFQLVARGLWPFLFWTSVWFRCLGFFLFISLFNPHNPQPNNNEKSSVSRKTTLYSKTHNLTWSVGLTPSACHSQKKCKTLEQLLATDILVLVTMKNAAKCDT